MLSVMVAAALVAAAPVDTAASTPRAAFAECLRDALREAKNQKIGVDAFDNFVRTHCAATEAALRTAVIAIDVKNGVSRKDAAENAKLEIDDYFVSTAERYGVEALRAQPPVQQAQAQPPQQ